MFQLKIRSWPSSTALHRGPALVSSRHGGVRVSHGAAAALAALPGHRWQRDPAGAASAWLGGEVLQEDFLVVFWIGKWKVRVRRGMVNLLFSIFHGIIVIICYHMLDGW